MTLKLQVFYLHLAIFYLVHEPTTANDQPISALVNTAPRFVSDLINTYTKVIHAITSVCFYGHTRDRPGISEQLGRRCVGRRSLGKPSNWGFLDLAGLWWGVAGRGCCPVNQRQSGTATWPVLVLNCRWVLFS